MEAVSNGEMVSDGNSFYTSHLYKKVNGLKPRQTQQSGKKYLAEPQYDGMFWLHLAASELQRTVQSQMLHPHQKNSFLGFFSLSAQLFRSDPGGT